ncbi:tam Trans-aconitate 2-methyltransferase [Burkholderiaceae bacterium]
MKNLIYKTALISEYFTSNRIRWKHFYPSEKKIITNLNLSYKDSVLDLGCGCGGLGLALFEEFEVSSYTGVEINSQAAREAKVLSSRAEIICGDILNVGQNELKDKEYDVVFSLSCVDWNIQFEEMFAAAWGFVKPGGHLVVTFRLTNGKSVVSMQNSYQFINFSNQHEGERAAYVVLNINNLFTELNKLDPLKINAYGYWGRPSLTAVTPYDSLCFTAFSIQKRVNTINSATQLDLELPQDVLNLLDGKSD